MVNGPICDKIVYNVINYPALGTTGSRQPARSLAPAATVRYESTGRRPDDRPRSAARADAGLCEVGVQRDRP
jgi:hypothetical protein